MMPNDLIVRSGGSVARLEQGPRVTRHGYVYKFRDVKGSSHRHLKADLEATRGDDGIGMVHLCATTPCALPPGDKAMVRICSSCVVPHSSPINVADLAKLSPAGRARAGGRLAVLGRVEAQGRPWGVYSGAVPARV
eukprot:6601670-Pyramimonas_sp.AAC.1